MSIAAGCRLVEKCATAIKPKHADVPVYMLIWTLTQGNMHHTGNCLMLLLSRLAPCQGWYRLNTQVACEQTRELRPAMEYAHLLQVRVSGEEHSDAALATPQSLLGSCQKLRKAGPKAKAVWAVDIKGAVLLVVLHASPGRRHEHHINLDSQQNFNTVI